MYVYGYCGVKKCIPRFPLNNERVDNDIVGEQSSFIRELITRNVL